MNDKINMRLIECEFNGHDWQRNQFTNGEYVCSKCGSKMSIREKNSWDRILKRK